MIMTSAQTENNNDAVASVTATTAVAASVTTAATSSHEGKLDVDKPVPISKPSIGPMQGKLARKPQGVGGPNSHDILDITKVLGVYRELVQATVFYNLARTRSLPV